MYSRSQRSISTMRQRPSSGSPRLLAVTAKDLMRYGLIDSAARAPIQNCLGGFSARLMCRRQNLFVRQFRPGDDENLPRAQRIANLGEGVFLDLG